MIAREGQVQTSPWFKANIVKPSSALSKRPSSASIISSKKILGDLPPNSRVTGIIFCDAYCIIKRPVVVSPVNAIFAIRLELASGFPASKPKPLTILSVPGGKRSAISSITTSIDTGVCSAGFKTTQFPAASAGASFHTAIKNWKIPWNNLTYNT